jgi:NADPH-dependent F420 reductase
VTVAIVGGTGPEGSGLALRWVRAGERVIIGSRDGQRAAAAAARVAETARASTGATAPSAAPPAAGDTNVSGAENLVACAAADIVVLTVPYEAHAETLKQLKPVLRPGQILVDTSVPLAASIGGRPSRTVGVWQGSAAQEAQELSPDGVAVVAAFHNVSAELLKQDGPVDCDVIVCSDDREAAKRVRELARRIPGVRALDGGKLENARIVEQITALLIGLNIRHKGHTGIRITGLANAAYEL